MKKRTPPAAPPAVVTLAVRIPPELRRRLRIYCASSGADMQAAVREAVEEYLKKRGA